MADETTIGRQDTASNEQAANGDASAVPEPTILEEVIIKKKPKEEPATAQQPPAPSVPREPENSPAAQQVDPSQKRAAAEQPVPPAKAAVPMPRTRTEQNEPQHDMSAVLSRLTGEQMPQLVKEAPVQGRRKFSFASLPQLFKEAPKIVPEETPAMSERLSSQVQAEQEPVLDTPIPQPSEASPEPLPLATPAPDAPMMQPTEPPTPESMSLDEHAASEVPAEPASKLVLDLNTGTEIPQASAEPATSAPAAAARVPTELQPITQVPPTTRPTPPIPTQSTLEAAAPRSSETPPAPAQPKQTPFTVPEQHDLNADIQNILSDAKIPERPDQKQTGGMVPTPQGPTSLQDAIATQSIKEDALAVVMTPQSAQQHESNIVMPVRTLKNDLQEIVKEQKISVVRAVSLEADQKNKRRVGASPAAIQRSHRAFGIIFTVAILFVLGGAALLGVYFIMQQQTAAPIVPQYDSLLFAEQTVTLPISDTSPNSLKRLIESARNAGGATLGSITHIVPVVTETADDGTQTQRQATLAEFLKALGTHAPDDLVRALGNDFFFGIHTVDKNAPLFVIPVVSYDRAFAGMLSWEPAMNTDLAPAFTAVPVLTTDPQTGIPVQRTFADLVMRNYDVRALRTDAGVVELYYSFPTQNLLVIAESPYSFTEILSRLQAAREL